MNNKSPSIVEIYKLNLQTLQFRLKDLLTKMNSLEQQKGEAETNIKALKQLINSKKKENNATGDNRNKNPAAIALGRLGGLKGGKARAKKLTKEQRIKIARKAATARWAKIKKQTDFEFDITNKKKKMKIKFKVLNNLLL